MAVRVYLQFSISDAYARRDAKSQNPTRFSPRVRVWWSGMGCGIVPLAAVLIAYAYEESRARAGNRWDFAEDCLVTHGPSGTLNMATACSARGHAVALRRRVASADGGIDRLDGFDGLGMRFAGPAHRRVLRE